MVLQVNHTPISTDEDFVSTFGVPLQPEVRLISHCDDAPERMVYYLTGAVLACGGQILSRRFHSDGSAALECEFERSFCVEVYGMLLASGLYLSRSSHLKMAELCQCTYQLSLGAKEQIVLLELEILDRNQPQKKSATPSRQIV